MSQGSGTVRIFAGNGRLVLLPLADEGFNFPSFVESFVSTIFLFDSLDGFRPLDSILERTISELDSSYSKRYCNSFSIFTRMTSLSPTFNSLIFRFMDANYEDIVRKLCQQKVII